jgi:hypothetical protein
MISPEQAGPASLATMTSGADSEQILPLNGPGARAVAIGRDVVRPPKRFKAKITTPKTKR